MNDIFFAVYLSNLIKNNVTEEKQNIIYIIRSNRKTKSYNIQQNQILIDLHKKSQGGHL